MLTSHSIATLVVAVLLSASAASQAGSIAQPYGTAVQAQAAQREVRIDAMTKYVNVERGETVRFVTPQGSFTWNFDTDRNRSQFAFAAIAPQGVDAKSIRVFVGDPASDR